jgi:hypothetical protein
MDDTNTNPSADVPLMDAPVEEPASSVPEEEVVPSDVEETVPVEPPSEEIVA